MLQIFRYTFCYFEESKYAEVTYKENIFNFFFNGEINSEKWADVIYGSPLRYFKNAIMISDPIYKQRAFYVCATRRPLRSNKGEI